jgi:hypothetical protein
MLDEGNHTIKVCVGVICEHEVIRIQFAKKTFVDFEGRLRAAVEFPEPTIRLIDYYRDGDGVAVAIEFINPTTKDLFMSAEISVGYSFISSRTGQRVGESARGKTFLNVEAGDRVTDTLHIYFDDGTAYMFDPPTLINVKIG